MAQRLLNVRVRPQRVVVLINRDGTDADLLLAFEFFSKLWGGRFAQILPVDPNSCDPLTEFRLACARPEFIYGIGLDDEYWVKATLHACQPRGYGKLRAEFVNALKHHHFEEFYLVDHALIHLSRTRDQNRSHKRTRRFVTAELASTLYLYCAAMFGIHHENLSNEFWDEEYRFAGTTPIEFVALATEFVVKWQQSWLDVTGHELNLRSIGPGWGFAERPPTVVLVADHVQDMSLFWNLRTASDSTHPAWIIPIPVDGAADPGLWQVLKEWLLAFLPYGRRPNFCHVTSQTVGEVACRQFAEQLRNALQGTPPIEIVDFEPPQSRIPVVVPYEYEATWPVTLNGQNSRSFHQSQRHSRT